MDSELTKKTKKNIFSAYFSAYFGFNLFRALIKNFCVEIFSVSGTQIGILEAIREIPGLMGAGAGLLARYIPEGKLLYISLFLLGFGVTLIGIAPTFALVVAATFIMSLGFHYFYSIGGSINMHIFSLEELPHILSKIRSLGSVTLVSVTILVIALFKIVGYRLFFVITGALVMAAALALWRNRPRIDSRFEKPKITIQKKYWKYYTLTFLAGMRRHIFTTFALFLLVKIHNTPPQTIAILLLINGFITIWTNRLSGKVVNAIGEKLTLVIEYSILVFVFIAYGWIENVFILYVLFMMDQIIFGFSIGVQTYFQKIAKSADITGNIALGQTLNHVAAVIIPVAGGVIWDILGFKYVFLSGAFVALITIMVAVTLPSKQDLKKAQ